MSKLVKRWSRLTALTLFALCLVFGTAIAPAHAEGPPGIPCQYYGYAYINGSLAANGKLVVAKINANQVGSVICASVTGYNYNFSFSGGNDGDTIVFFVDGVQATPTSVYHPGYFNGSPFPSQPPFNLYTYTSALGVATGSATGIFSTAAVLAGTLTGLGASPTATVSFEYGTTTAYGNTTTPQAMSAPGGFTAGITGLAPSTTYHFRAKATDGANTINGLDASFTTLTPVLTVITGSATGITTSTATLSGTLSDMGGYSSVNVSFDYGTTTSYGSSTGAQSKTSTGAFAATVSGLTPGTTYHFRAKATAGTATATSDDRTFTTSSQTGGCTSGCCQWIYGTAYLNGTPLNSGTIVALVNGVQAATATTNTGGGYNFYVPVTAGATVTFTVGGALAAQSLTGQCMGVSNNYNLYAATGTVAVTTGTGTYATTSSAIINGNLTSLGTDSSATVNFEWGTSAAYGSTTTTTSLASTGPFTGAISGLTAGVTYYYRAKAVGNPSGTIVYGSGMTYVHNAGGTLSVTTGSGSYLSTTTATLTSTLAGLASDTSATCYIDYGLSTIYGSTATGGTRTSTGSYSGTASGLTVGQTYHIRGRVVGSPSGTTALGSDVTYYHSSGGTLAVTTGSGTYLTTTTANLSGTVASLGSDTSASVSLEYGTSTAYGSVTTPATVTSTGGFSGTASGLTAGQTYHLRAKAVGSPSGSTVYGSDATYIHTSGTGTEIVGSTTDACAINVMGGALWLYRCQASGSNTITTMNVKVSFPGHVKVAIYADDAGAVGSLIIANNTSSTVTNDSSTTPASSKVNQIPLSTSITSGTYYWLAVVSDTDTVGGTRVAGTSLYQTISTSFADYTFPSTVTGYITSFNGRLLLAGAY